MLRMMESRLHYSSALSQETTLEENQLLWDDWHVLARSSDLPSNQPLPARLLGVDLVLWRATNGQVLAWEDRCPHRGMLLSTGRVVDNTLVCPYHGLAYNPKGHCVKIPAYPKLLPPRQACVRTYTAQERYGLIFVSLGHPNQDIATFPVWNAPGYRQFLCGPYHYQASGLRVIENFFDIAHFPFVHDALLGDSSRPTVADYQVAVNENGITLSDVHVWQPDPDGTGHGAIVTNTYWIYRPLSLFFSKESKNMRLSISFMVTPVDEEACIGWMWTAMNYAHDLPESGLRAFQDRVVAQDIAIVEAQRPRRLPLNLNDEFHLPCDRASVAYRQWLSDLQITFGTTQS